MAKDEAIKIISELEAKYGGILMLGLMSFSLMSKDEYFLYIEAQRAAQYF